MNANKIPVETFKKKKFEIPQDSRILLYFKKSLYSLCLHAKILYKICVFLFISFESLQTRQECKNVSV